MPFCAYFTALGLMKASYSKSPCNWAQSLTLIIRAACHECVCEGGGSVTRLEASSPKDIMTPD